MSDNRTYLEKPEERTVGGYLSGLIRPFRRTSVMEPSFIDTLTAPEGSPIDYHSLQGLLGSRLREALVDPGRRFIDAINAGFSGQPIGERERRGLLEGLMSIPAAGMMSGVGSRNVLRGGIPVMQGRSKKGLTEFFNPQGVAWGTTDRGTAEQFANVVESHYPYRNPPETVREMRGEVYDLEFDIKDPMEVDISETLWNPRKEAEKIEQAKSLGHDGLVINHPSGKKDYVAFSPDQVRKVQDPFDELDALPK